MTPRSANFNILLLGWLLVGMARAEAGGDDPEASAAAGAGAGAAAGAAAGALSGLGDFGKQFGGENLGNMFKSMTENGGNAISDFMNNLSGSKVISDGEKREGGKEGSGFMGVKDPMEFFKLMLNPTEFMNRLAKEFKLDRGELTQAVGRGMNVGFETAVQPPMVVVRIIEKVFVPDACKLKFVCEMGRHMTMFKSQMPKVSDSYFEGASTAKAMYDGVSGRECDQFYVCADGPKLKKEFAGLKHKIEGDHEDYAASSLMAAFMPKARN